MKYQTILATTTAIFAATSVHGYQSLKSAAGSFRIGVAVDSSRFNDSKYINAMSNFNYMVAENACKMAYIQPSKGTYNFTPCDEHYNKAKELGMKFRGHALVWHSMPPSWFENLTGNNLKNAMVDHITKTLKHYEGKIDSWDVVNEAIDDNSSGSQWKYRQSFLYNNVPNFVELAFTTARQVSPKTKLFYNDYNTEGLYAKSEAVYNFIKDLRNKGIPIDGVGLQYHVSTSAYPKYDNINSLINRYCKLGVIVHITEMDVASDGNSSKQATVFSEALQACLNNSCCKAFLVWGVGDNDSWLGSGKTGLIFDSNYQPKAAYTSLLNILKKNISSSTTTTTKKTTSTKKSSKTTTTSKSKATNYAKHWESCGTTKASKTCETGSECIYISEYDYYQCVPESYIDEIKSKNNSNCAALWKECGNFFSGPTSCCQEGECQYVQEYTYWQCRPKETNTNTAATCADEWTQCGGDGWTGPTCCKNNAKCTYVSEYNWYQCIPNGF